MSRPEPTGSLSLAECGTALDTGVRIASSTVPRRDRLYAFTMKRKDAGFAALIESGPRVDLDPANEDVLRGSDLR